MKPPLRLRHVLFAFVPALLALRVSVPGSADPLEGTLSFEGAVRPNPSALGQPVGFRLTVTNTGDEPARYGVSGCPVLYAIDGVYEPLWACAQSWEEIILEPGESRTYGPDNDENLLHEPWDYPLGPGEHVVGLHIFGAGGVRVPFHVDPPLADRTYASGRLLAADGTMLRDGVVRLSRANDPNGATPPPDEEHHEAKAGNEGYWFIGGIAPGKYRLSATANGVTLWYPGFPAPDEAETLSLEGGEYRSGLDFYFPGGHEPPPQTVLTGTVFEPGEAGGRRPLADAWVVAVPASWGNDDGTIGPDGTPQPGPWQDRFHTLTGEDGVFELPVPPGDYRLVAGKPGYLYEYWRSAGTWGEAEIIPIHPPQPDPFEHVLTFDLLPSFLTVEGRIEGQVMDDNPFDRAPLPVMGATVTALPINPYAPEVILAAKTDSTGLYAIDVPGDTPYRVMAEAEGFQSEFYNNKLSHFEADGVDTAPGVTTAGIDFGLQPDGGPPPPPLATLRGAVYRPIGNVGQEPVADAWVVAIPVVIRPEGDYTGPGGTDPSGVWQDHFFTLTGDEGRFELPVPPGAYRVLAGKGGHQYQYWRGASRWDEAEIVTVWGPDNDPFETDFEFLITPIDLTVQARIEGQVWDDNPMLGRPPIPLEGAMVTALAINPYGPEAIWADQTDATGSYAIDVPGDTPYRVVAEADGFRPEYYQEKLSLFEADGVDVKHGETTAGINFGIQPWWSPPPGATLHGVVFETSENVEKPLGGAFVVAVPMGFASEDSVYPDGTTTDPANGYPLETYVGTTKDDGTFALDVPSGSYRVFAGTQQGHRYQYWNHVALWSLATPVSAWNLPPPGSGPPEQLHTFHLASAGIEESAEIRGQVLAFDPINDGPPQPLAGATVAALSVGPMYERVYLHAVTDENGLYAMHVPYRSPYYVLTTAEGYNPQYYNGHSYTSNPDGVDVGPGGVTDHVDFVLQPGYGDGGAIEGWVYEQHNDKRCPGDPLCTLPAPGVKVRVEAAYPTFAPYILETYTNQDGYFRVDGITASSDGSLSYYVSAIREDDEPRYYPGGVSFERAEPLVVYPGQTSSADRILLPPPGGNSHGLVAGQILDSEGQGIAGAEVWLYVNPEDPYGRVLFTLSRADGGFIFLGVPENASPIVAAGADGYVPAYYPGVYRWQTADRVGVGGPAVYLAPVLFSLQRAMEGGPYIQAGRVRVAEPEDPDSTTVPPGGSLSPRNLALKHHERNVPRAHFYLVNALSASPIEVVVAGSMTGDNGVTVLTGLPEGVYYAFGDRPGFETAYFTGQDGERALITLNATTPGVLAEIFLTPLGGGGGGESDDAAMVNDVLNAPNPFQGPTTIHFSLMEEGAVSVQVFDYQGRHVRTLVANDMLQAGERAIPWDGKDEHGRAVGAGVYFYRVRAGNEAVTRKMVLVSQ